MPLGHKVGEQQLYLVLSLLLFNFIGISRPEDVLDKWDVALVDDRDSVTNDTIPHYGNDTERLHVDTDTPQSENLTMLPRRRHRHPPASDEKRLTKYLLYNYQKVGRGGRPVSNSTAPILVKFGLAMIQMDLDEKENVLSSSVWCRYRWHDDYITWDPEEFGGVHTIRLSSAKIWIPDIMLYNTANTHKMERDVLAVIEYNGDVLWIPHRIYRASCAVDVTNYPFDQQTCDMTFGSWAYHGNEIDLGFYDDMEMLDISDLERESSEWDIISKNEFRKSQHYDCCKDPYVTLTFTLSMRRKLVFSSFILTLPCIFLACMTLVVFWLPPERPDRTSLAMSLFASFLLLLLILVEAAPPTASSVPTLGLYYCFNMVLIMLSIFLSSVVININKRGEEMQRVPEWLKTITSHWIKKLLCIPCQRRRQEDCEDTAPQQSRDVENRLVANQEAMHIKSNAQPREVQVTLTPSNGVQSIVVQQNSCVSSGVLPAQNSNGKTNFRQIALDEADDGGSDDVTSDSSPLLETDLKKSHSLFKALLTRLRVLEKHLSNTENGIERIVKALTEKDITLEMRQLEKEWQLVALTLDRIFFLCFLIAIMVSLGTLFPRPYQLQF